MMVGAHESWPKAQTVFQGVADLEPGSKNGAERYASRLALSSH